MCPSVLVYVTVSVTMSRPSCIPLIFSDASAVDHTVAPIPSNNTRITLNSYFCSCTIRHFPVRHFPVLQISVLQIQLSPYDAIYTRKLKFLTKLQSTEIGWCKRFVTNTVDELATMHECVRVMTTSYI